MHKENPSILSDSPLGQHTIYAVNYSPELLFPVPRSLARSKIGLSSSLPFHGVDIWTGFELSWLNAKGKPEIGLATFIFPCTSQNIVESKSFKFYLNSFNQTSFQSIEDVEKTLESDLSQAIQDQVTVNLSLFSNSKFDVLDVFQGNCLDDLDVEIDTYQLNPSFLKTNRDQVEETVFSHLLKSNCLVTGQPDWGSLLIRYAGRKIDHEGLLKYIISFRNHYGFAEHCVEHIFNDISIACKPERLTVYARYTRRGGLDINPFRSNFEEAPLNQRMIRQ